MTDIKLDIDINIKPSWLTDTTDPELLEDRRVFEEDIRDIEEKMRWLVEKKIEALINES